MYGIFFYLSLPDYLHIGAVSKKVQTLNQFSHILNRKYLSILTKIYRIQECVRALKM